MRSLARTLRNRAKDGLWLIPSAMVVTAVLLALLTTTLDDRIEHRPFTEWIFTGGPDSARSILQIVASSVITFTALVFTITVVALQLSSQQFSPRVLRAFLQDLQSKVALGMFIGTFIYCLMVLRVISASEDRGVTIPSISMMVLLVLVLASIATFVAYISHMTSSIRVSQIIDSVGDEARRLIETLPHPNREQLDRSLLQLPPTAHIEAPQPGILVEVDHEGLIRLGKKCGSAFAVTRKVGDFLAERQVVMEVRGGEVDREAVLTHVNFANERNMRQDVNFGIRQLVDIAERALSPSLNDPTTAVMAIDRIHDLLRRLADRPFPDHEHADDDGVVRVVSAPLSWDSLVNLGVAEIRHFAGGSMQVTRRLLAALRDLEKVALSERKGILQKEIKALERLADRSFDDDEDRRLAKGSDQQGAGG